LIFSRVTNIQKLNQCKFIVFIYYEHRTTCLSSDIVPILCVERLNGPIYNDELLNVMRITWEWETY